MSSFGPALSVTLFVADAARHATPEQRARLKSEALPPLRDTKLTASEAYRAVLTKTVEIMGPDWDLDPETKAWIDGLLDGTTYRLACELPAGHDNGGNEHLGTPVEVES